MNSVLICLFFSFIVYSQGIQVNTIQGNPNLNEITKQLKSDGQKAISNLQQKLGDLHSEFKRHELVKRDIDSSLQDLINHAPNCKTDIHAQLIELKNDAVNGYMNCTSKTIYRAVGDSVKIVTISFNLFSQIFSAIDDIINGFTECYSSGIWHSISCTIESVGETVYDVKQSVDLIASYGGDVTLLGKDVTNIIDVCKHKNNNVSNKFDQLLMSC